MYIGCDTYELVHGKYTLTLDEIQTLVLDIQDQGIINIKSDIASEMKIKRLERKIDKLQKDNKIYRAELKKETAKKLKLLESCD